jgi:manganese/zinc/iron transport system permease protein
MNRVSPVLAISLFVLLMIADQAPVAAAEQHRTGSQRSITDRSISWPTWSDWRRVMLLEDYNTRVVLLGTTLLGLAAGTIGSFTLLRKRALMGDALSHATLPGIAVAFMSATYLGLDGKSLPWLLAGAAVSGVLGMVGILFIRKLTRLDEDAALGIVLSVFFGAGMAGLGIVQQMPTGNAAGLESFIYGKTASMVAGDAWLIAAAGLGCASVCGLLFKELKLLCFDEDFAGSRGFPVMFLDVVLMSLVVIVTIIGLQTVGLILMIALFVIPAAAARFWTERLSLMTVLAAILGGGSGMVGAAMSALFPKLPSGAMIVLVSASLFSVSMFCGAARGILIRWIRRHRLHVKIDRQHLLRAMYEQLESRGPKDMTHLDSAAKLSFDDILRMRSWSMRRLQAAVERAVDEGLMRQDGQAALQLTAAGHAEAARLVRQHRLWELYLITHADVAPSKVDRDADAIEHVLDRELIAKLETLLERDESPTSVVTSPHPIRLERETLHMTRGT